VKKLRFETLSLGFAWLAGLVLPLVGTIGPESALAMGVLLSPLAAATGALFALRARSVRISSSLLLSRAVGQAWLSLAVMVAMVALNAVRVKTCEPFAGLSFIALGPWASVTLAAVIGVAIATLVPQPRLALTLAVLVPFVAIGSALADFVRSPSVFAFGHFFGYFPGPIYERRIDVPDAWLSHRLLSALLGAGLWTFVIAARHTRSGRVSFLRLYRHPVLAAMVAVCAVAASTMGVLSHRLGHTTSRAHVENKLGLALEGPLCRTVLPRETPIAEAQRLAEDCELRVTQVATRLGVTEKQRITAFFFRSVNEKRALMGAGRVYIAKPWRREVYLQLGDYPHPVLAHELAHVVARHAASGAFGVPGKLGGLIPEPTLVEGMAVALEPAPRDELTPHQWAKAAHQAGVAPKLSSLLGPRFFGTNQQLAYTLAGSFLGYLLETRGAEVVRRVYREGDVQHTLGAPFATLEKDWKAWLAATPLPERAAALARQRFERPGVFSQVCPHAVERLNQELGSALSAGDLPRAAGKCREVLDIDPKDSATRATLAGLLARQGDDTGAERELSQLTGARRAPAPTIARARLAIADAALLRGEFESAEQSYRALLDEPLGEAELRQLEVRLLALEAGDPTRRLVAELLVGQVGRETGARAAMHLIHALAPLRSDGLAHYLAARQLAGEGRHDLAHPLLREASQRGLPTRRLRAEALRMRALSAFVLGALDDASASLEELGGLPDVTAAEQGELADFATRIAHRRAALARR
jgi:tetratricopeptide (TPR) repeat protein